MLPSTLKATVAIATAAVLTTTAIAALHVLLTHYEAELAEASREEDKVWVMVAQRDLYPGIPIEPDDLLAIPLQPRFVPDGAFLSPEHVVGQRARERILAEDIVRGERLANPERGEGLHAILPSEMRAISVEVKDGAAVSGFVDPGNYVDLLVVMDATTDGRNGPDKAAHTLAEQLFVLGVNRDSTAGSAVDARGARAPSMTLLVTPEQAEQIAHAEHAGTLRFTLRADHDTSRLPPAVQESYAPSIGGTRQAPTAVVSDPECANVRIINGPQVRDHCFEALPSP